MSILINQYTARWDAAMRPQQPNVGDVVEVSYDPDGREWNAFLRVLSPNLAIRFIDNDPDSHRDIYEVVERKPGEGPIQ